MLDSRQYDEVVAKYKDTDQWLKAPNGKDTNLTERQWVMVRTQNFKNWFGDWENDPENASKVVDESEVFERFNESSPYWNTRRGQSFTQSIQRRLSNNEMSEIDLNLDLVSKYQRESQDKNLEKVLAQIDIDLLNSNLDKGLLFKEKITRALDYLRIGYTTQNRANASSQYLKLKLPNGNSIDVRASDHPQKYKSDISVERNWKAAIRFIVDQNKEDTWGTKDSDYWAGNARLRFSLGDEEELSEKEKAKLFT